MKLVSIKCPARSCNHLGVELQGDDFSLGSLSTFVPSQGTVSGVAANLEDWCPVSMFDKLFCRGLEPTSLS
jgi:hypothetical protein